VSGLTRLGSKFLSRMGMRYQWKNPRLYAVVLGDAVLFCVAHVVAYLCRFEFRLNAHEINQIRLVLPYLVAIKLAVFGAFGQYRGMWRYTSLTDFWKLFQACVVSMFLVVGMATYLYRFESFSRAVFLIDGLFTFLLTGALRMGIRSYYEGQKYQLSQLLSFSGLRGLRDDSRKVVIIGAGDAGEKILREIFDNPQIRYTVVGFLDDNPMKRGRSMHGVTVLGAIESLPRVVEDNAVNEALIAIPSASGAELRRVVDLCKSAGIPHKTLPGIGEIINGKVSIKALRDVNYQDLLGRPPVKLDTENIQDFLSDQTVLITGCGGSIGAELCRQVVRFVPAALVLLDAGEANLFQIQMELRHELDYHNHHVVLGRVQDHALVTRVFDKFRPAVVFHAAAYKHVPMLELNPWEAITNNVLGSQIVMEAAMNFGVGRFVLVSTDKAVRPTNVMGASKRVTELLLQSLQGKSSTRFMAVRFGNVVGSSGSVIPLFQRQIERGGPVTVTHPEVTRYFMTIPEAAQLILQAGAMGQGGEVFVLEMGTPVKIADMARDLIRLSGKEPDKGIEIIYTGLRAGEKLFEELVTAGEGIVSTRHEKIMVLRSNGKWIEGGRPESSSEWLQHQVGELYQLAKNQEARAIKQKLQEIVPEYRPQEVVSIL